MNIKHRLTEPPTPNRWNLSVQKFHDSPFGEVLHLTLAPGQRMLRHIPPTDLLFYVLEGTPLVEWGGERRAVEQESFIHLPKGAATCVYNESEHPARLLIVKLPKTDAPPVFLE